MAIARVKKSGTLYKTAGACHLIAISINESPNLWHHKLGYMSEKRMKVMHLDGKLSGLQSIEIYMCEDCILGKHKRVSFQQVGEPQRRKKLSLSTMMFGVQLSSNILVGRNTS